jgi:Bacteriophage Mu, Gp27
MSGDTPPAEAPVAKKRRVQRRFKIRRLPAEIRKELDQRLIEGNFTDYRGLSAWLEERGFEISPSAINYYARKFERRLEAVRLATAQARTVVADTAGADDGHLQQALMNIVQTTLFEMMIELADARGGRPAAPNKGARTRAAGAKEREAEGADEGDDEGAGASASAPPSKSDLSAVESIGRTVAAMARVQLEWNKWRTQARERVERGVGAASAQLTEAAKGGGLSAEAEARIRSALLEIRV